MLLLRRNLFSSQLYSKRLAKNPLLRAISLLVPTGPLRNNNLLASQMSVNFEPNQRTDISTQPLGPAPNISTRLFVMLRVIFKTQRVGPIYMREPNPTEPTSNLSLYYLPASCNMQSDFAIDNRREKRRKIHHSLERDMFLLNYSGSL